MIVQVKDTEELLSRLLKEGESLPFSIQGILDRYPVRFLLLDSYQDSYCLIETLIKNGVKHLKCSDLFNCKQRPDKAVSCSRVFPEIENFSKKHQGKWLLSSFAELVRFCSPQEVTSLIGQLLLMQKVDKTGVERLYIPMVASEGFFTSHRSRRDILGRIWKTNSEKRFAYHFFAARNIPSGYSSLETTQVDTFEDYLALGLSKIVNLNIISRSDTLFKLSSSCTQLPGFHVDKCENDKDFIEKILGIKLSGMPYYDSHKNYWSNLANHLVANENNLDKIVFKTFALDKDAKTQEIIRALANHENNDYHIWLLITLCKSYFCLTSSFLANSLTKIKHSSIADVLNAFFLTWPSNKEEAHERALSLGILMQKSSCVSDKTQEALEFLIHEKLSDKDVMQVLPNITNYTRIERCYLTEWLAQGKVSTNDVEEVYSDLFYYMQELPTELLKTDCYWVKEYISAYKKAKIANTYTAEIREYIETRNADAFTFSDWYDSFPLVDKQLHNRNDIDEVYWIDGLGIDWIPFIQNFVKNYGKTKAFVNEVYICHCALPSTTEKNKHQLQQLGKELRKIGDLDKSAHEVKSNINDVLEKEFDILKNALDEILFLSAGKKIAIVSDHGLSFLAHLSTGTAKTQFETEHAGRLARTRTKPTQDSDYYVWGKEDDGKWTVCALSHRSLGGKTRSIQGAHGGCTPEEVLIPVFIISPEEAASRAKAYLLNPQIDLANPILRFRLEHVSVTDKPTVEYNGEIYKLRKDSSRDEWITTEITLREGVKSVTYKSSGLTTQFPIEFKLGAVTDDDLFEF